MKRALALSFLALALLEPGPAQAQSEPDAQGEAEPDVEAPAIAEGAPPNVDVSESEPANATASTEGEPAPYEAAEAASEAASDEAVPDEAVPDEEYVLGQSALHLDIPASSLSPELAGRSAEETLPHHDLELALRLPTYDFDGVSFISASRSLFTAVLETYCAAGLLFPGDDGYDVGEVLLGAGCLLGATTLYIMGVRKILHPSEERRAAERLERFEALRNGVGLNDEDVAMFENELHSAARRDRRRRIVEIILGGLNIVATATIAGLTARGRIRSTVGTSIATGTAAVGVMSLSSIFIRSPSERAWSNYEAR